MRKLTRFAASVVINTGVGTITSPLLRNTCACARVYPCAFNALERRVGDNAEGMRSELEHVHGPKHWQERQKEITQTRGDKCLLSTPTPWQPAGRPYAPGVLTRSSSHPEISKISTSDPPIGSTKNPVESARG